MGIEQQPSAAPGLAWIEQNQGVAVAFAFVLTTLYVTPILIIAAAAWTTDFFQQDSLLFAWFAAFMKSSESTLNEFHKVLFPVMSALSIIAFRGRPTKAMLWLAFFILFLFAVTVAVAVIFDMSSTVTALSGLEEPLDTNLAKAFFTRVQETLLMYLMMLIGISVVNGAK
ncbi:MAG: hypothetical protein K0M66_06855 [Thiobacillus sp.]|nr:hypothetical protein [Thiobacillus sp.]